MAHDFSIYKGLIILIFSFVTTISHAANVNITAEIESVSVEHGENQVVIKRNQDLNNTINPAFAKTSRQCPPSCIQPAKLAAGVDTIAEIEVLDYLKQRGNGDDSILIIDTRLADWVAKGTIPGAINIPWTKLDSSQGADSISIGAILQEKLNARNLGGLWDFTTARTLVLFCNGIWCGEASNSIINLLRYGYPAHKIKWYRGGMQSWESLGLTTIAPVK
ncbi:MAG: rhodanese-related sulfurtransferase [Gammaproteobacteria bacterium]|jgi:rhodanese-related sulfurtransferase